MNKVISMLDQARIRELGKFYRKHLLVDVMPFWEVRTKDAESEAISRALTGRETSLMRTNTSGFKVASFSCSRLSTTALKRIPSG